ncbi:MAG: hypothetical protein GY794_22845 [bacterium]|nr:hypothetical protein [bacterium]
MEKKRSWIVRRWYLIVIGVIVLGGGLMAIVVTTMKSSDAYCEALERARGSKALVEAIGTPMEDGFLPTGSISVSGDFGEAKMSISVSGPKGSATVYFEAEKSMKKWTFILLKAVVDKTETEIDLLAENPGNGAP